MSATKPKAKVGCKNPKGSQQRRDLRSREVGKYEWAAGKLADMAKEETDPHLKRLFENAAAIAALIANGAASQIDAKLSDSAPLSGAFDPNPLKEKP